LIHYSLYLKHQNIIQFHFIYKRSKVSDSMSMIMEPQDFRKVNKGDRLYEIAIEILSQAVPLLFL
jgi:hypothetical protein